MSKLRRAGLVISIIVLTVTGLGIWSPQTVEAKPITCSGPIIAFGRQRWCGYFSNRGNDSGDDVRNGGVPASVNTAQELINLVQSDLNSGNAQRITGAQFIIQTMRGRGPGAPKSVSPAEFDNWVDRVKSYANTSENGTTSFGENGRIDWRVWQNPVCGTINTYYQPTFNDVAPFLNSPSNSICEERHRTEEFILFRDTSGNVDYMIRRECMNPMGLIAGIEEPDPAEFSLSPSVEVTVGGGPVSGGVEVGQTVRFAYTVRNNGPDPSGAVNCQTFANVHAGYFPEPPVPTFGGGAGPPTTCPRVFTTGPPVQVTAPEDVVIAAGNQTICRSLFVNPASHTGGQLGDETCVLVVSKPYFKVYGGDMSAGNGFETGPGTCPGNANGSIIGWNRGPGGSYGGAGVQFAAFAMRHIFEVATSVGNSGVNVGTPPSGLAFAETSASGSVYGGTFGSISCIPDYYAKLPVSPMPFTTIAAATTSGAYQWTGGGALNLSGQVANGKRISLFVDGDVFIDGDIKYPASWAVDQAPLFQLVVKGDIFIKNTVSTIDGVFIAQKDGASGGTIHTCALAAATLPADNNLYSRCNGKLTINGVFAANQVRFLRTNGTLYGGSGSEAGSSGNIAEVFNFSPALWIAQPVGLDVEAGGYDSITSLPPIL